MLSLRAGIFLPDVYDKEQLYGPTLNFNIVQLYSLLGFIGELPHISSAHSLPPLTDNKQRSYEICSFIFQPSCCNFQPFQAKDNLCEKKQYRKG